MPPGAPFPEVWIDATRPAAGWVLWGMTLAERLVRQAGLAGARRARLFVSPASAPGAARLRPDLRRLYEVEVEVAEVADAAAVHARLAAVEAPLILLEGDVAADDRVLPRLLEAGPGAAACGDGAAALYLGPGDGPRLAAAPFAGWEAAARHLQVLPLEAIAPYVPELRLTMPAFLRRLTAPDQLRPLDHLMYRRTFKGVIDAVALYGYYHLVRWLTRHLSRTALAPNLFTALSILAVWAAVPCFALGRVAWGAALAWAGVLLDSVDGKLARLTLHLSDAMGALEHWAAMPGLGLWLLTLGWHLSGGDLLRPSPVAVACWILLAAFLADKAASGAFRALMGRELFDYRPVDAAFHLVAARRNLHLLFLTVGLLAGRPDAAYLAMAAWMAFTLAFHLARFAWVLLAGAPARTTP